MTVAIYGFCLALILVMRFAARSALGCWFNHGLVEVPLARLSRGERHQFIVVAIVLVMALAAGEAIAIYGTFEWAMISAFDLSVYLDAVAVTVALSAAGRIRAFAQVVRVRMPGPRRRPQSAARQRRAHLSKSPTKSANDDDHAALVRRAA